MAAIGQGNDTTMTIKVDNKIIVENVVLSNIISSYSYNFDSVSGHLQIIFASTVKGKFTYIRELKLYN